MIFKKKKVIDPTVALLDGSNCNPQCPFLVSPLKESGEFDYSKPYQCSKYNVELTYYDWVLICNDCYKDNIDDRGR